MIQFRDMVCSQCGRMMSYDPYFGKYVCRQCGLTLSARMEGADRMFGHVKLENHDGKTVKHKLFVDGEEIHYVSAVNINVEAGCVPQCTATIIPQNVEFDGQADVKYDFTPETVQQAVVVMRNELLKHGDFYDGFRASVMSAADEQFCKPDGATTDELIDAIMSRIIGED